MNGDSSEIRDLLRDVKERLIYLKELGVGEVDAALLEMVALPSRAQSREIRKPADKVAATVETVANRPAESTENRASSVIKAKETRKAIFDSIKLSSVKSKMKSKLSEARDDSDTTLPADEVAAKTNKISQNQTEVPHSSLPAPTETLEQIRLDIGKDCMRCELCEKRNQVVHSIGNPNADLMFVGEAPGKDEDEQGEPFVGRAGKLLTKIIEAIGLTRNDVFIGNINRCRPPDNRQPTIIEAESCRSFLLREIAVVRPKVIAVMGNTACQNLLETKIGITKLRGSFKDYFGVKVMPTFHPAYLLRDPRKKKEVWADLQLVRDYLNSQ